MKASTKLFSRLNWRRCQIDPHGGVFTAASPFGTALSSNALGACPCAGARALSPTEGQEVRQGMVEVVGVPAETTATATVPTAAATAATSTAAAAAAAAAAITTTVHIPGVSLSSALSCD